MELHDGFSLCRDTLMNLASATGAQCAMLSSGVPDLVSLPLRRHCMARKAFD